jgi:hypothetical protein
MKIKNKKKLDKNLKIVNGKLVKKNITGHQINL